MSIIWWTLYILGALSIAIVWINLMGLIGHLLKVIKNKEWAKVKVIEGPPGPKGERGERGPEGQRGLPGTSGSFIITDDLRNLVRSTVEGVVTNRGILTRKDIESLVRIEVAAHLSRLEISRTTFPGLGTEDTKIKMNNDGWYADKHKRHSDEEDK